MISPRWSKIVKDLWANRKRIILAVLSIAVGVFAVGTIGHMYLIVSRDLAKSYSSANPADIAISTSDLFDQDLVNAIARMPEVKQIQGWREISYQYRLPGGDQWKSIQFHVADDFNNLLVNKVYPEKIFGPDPAKWPNPALWPPPDRQIIMERTSLLTAPMGLTNARQEDSIILRLPGNRTRELTMSGLVYDPGRAPATFSAGAIGYINFNTVEWLGEPSGFNELRIVVNASPHTLENISIIGNKIKDKVERAGHRVFLMGASTPGKHPISSLIDPLILVLAALGLLTLPLSGFLVINTISAFLAQQVRQIGVMKAVGATSFQIVSMYLLMVVCFGLLSLMIAIPLAALAAYRLINFMAYFINFNLTGFYIPVEIIVLELTLGLLVPVISALHPVLKGAHITVREAISSYGLSQRGTKPGLIDRLVEKIRFLPRPLLLSLRNTFRRKARLALTLITLVLASSIFISVLSLRSSLDLTLEEIIRFNGFDVQVQLNQSYRMDRLQNEIAGIPGITQMEGWGIQGASRILPDGSETTELIVVEAIPANSKLLNPMVRSGRWLMTEDENALVVSPSFMDKQKDVRVGSEITLKMAGHKTVWKVVGVANTMDSGQMILFSNYSYFARLLNEQGKASILMLGTTLHDGPTQDAVLKSIIDRFNQAGIKTGLALTMEQNRAQNALLFDILTYMLLFMALLLALVGGLGLMGLMSINVIERTREIGVMRAIGATNRSILSIFMTEGLLIGGISWILGVLASLPLSRLLSDAIGVSMLKATLSYSYSTQGAMLWMLMVLIISAGATYIPARDAARLTVRDILAYE